MSTTTPQTILLVEDDDNDVTFMIMALKKADIAEGLQVACDGQEAIDYLGGHGKFGDRVRHPLPVLVMLDLKLPRVMGMEVLRWIRARPEFDLMVVIVLSSSQERSDIRTATSLGANSYLVKPSHPFLLTEIAELVKRYWLRLNQPTATFAVLPQ